MRCGSETAVKFSTNLVLRNLFIAAFLRQFITPEVETMKWFEKHKDWSPVILRVFFGIAFLVAGISKLLSLDLMKSYFVAMFGAAGPFLVWLVLAVEILGGLFLLVNWHGRESALVLSLLMIIALVLTWKLGPSTNIIGALSQMLIMNTSGAANTPINFAFLAGLLAIVFGECKQCT